VKPFEHLGLLRLLKKIAQIDPFVLDRDARFRHFPADLCPGLPVKSIQLDFFREASGNRFGKGRLLSDASTSSGRRTIRTKLKPPGSKARERAT
jgi:hypothetical protein